MKKARQEDEEKNGGKNRQKRMAVFTRAIFIQNGWIRSVICQTIRQLKSGQAEIYNAATRNEW